MITPGDATNIIYKDCQLLGINGVFHSGDEPKGEITTERIVIIPKKQESGRIWKKGFIEVNICVPDKDGRKDKIRTDELERIAGKLFKKKTGIWDGTRYVYSSDVFTEADTALKCHYVNVRILFKVLNTL